VRTATRDRGAIIHWAGRHRLSPALRDGAPAFAAGPDPALVRCGWEAFFAVLDRLAQSVAYDPEDPSSAAFLPRHQARALQARHDSFRAALARWRRFLAALLGRAPGSPPA
jgi:hypothetical protein